MKRSILTTFLLVTAPAIGFSATDFSNRTEKMTSKTETHLVQVRLSDLGLGNPEDEDILGNRIDLPAVEEAGLPAKTLQISFSPINGTLPIREAENVRSLLRDAHMAGIDLPIKPVAPEERASLKTAAENLPTAKEPLRRKLIEFVDAISKEGTERDAAFARFFENHFGPETAFADPASRESFAKSLTIRNAGPRDIPRLFELLKGTGLFWDIGDREEVFLEKMRFDPDSVIVLEHKGEIIGMVTTTYDPWASFIWHLAIDPRYQRRGLGHILAEEAERRLTARGTSSVNGYILPENRNSRRLFDRRGYSEMSSPIIAVEKPFIK